jgi:hypothetical protein
MLNAERFSYFSVSTSAFLQISVKKIPLMPPRSGEAWQDQD